MSSGAPFDPMQAAFSMGQELYKAGLLSTVNQRRMAKGAGPVAWPVVGATPTDEVWREGGARLLRFQGNDHGATAPKPPLLLVCSLINRPYVLDLLPERSVVQRLLTEGLDVWLLDWGTPLREDADLSLADYALGRLPRALDAVCAATGRDAVHVLGYCMGGTFALMALGAERLRAASLIALATPVDFHDRGMLSTWCRSPGFDGKSLARSFGNVPPHLLQPAFKMLDPVSIATKLVHLEDKITDDEFLRFFLAMEIWLEDSVAFPGGAFGEWVAAYRANSLARGKLLLDGERIDLARVRCPILTVVAEGDYITPPDSSLALERLAGTRDHEVIRMKGGHVGLSTGRAAHESLWPRAAAWIKERDPARPTSLRKRTTKSSKISDRTMKSESAPVEPARESDRVRSAKSVSTERPGSSAEAAGGRHNATAPVRERTTNSPVVRERTTNSPVVRERTTKSAAVRKRTTKSDAVRKRTTKGPNGTKPSRSER